MRVPDTEVVAPARALRPYQLAALLLLGSLALVVILVQAVGDAYANYLWYRSIHLTMVWRSIVETKLGLGAFFSGTFFFACWTSLYLVDRNSPPAFLLTPEQEVQRRYQGSLGRFPGLMRTVVSIVLSIAVGVGATSQWQHWLLFVNGGKFGLKDPQFGRDVGFYVFRLPFLSFLVDWSLIALLVLLVVTSAAYYLTGSLRATGPRPRSDARVVAHLSFILSAMALVRAAAYFFVDRYGLDLSSHGLLTGADYVDVHVRLPAMMVLTITCLVAFSLLTYNIYHRTWGLPAVAVGLWAFVAFAIGILYPAVVQWLRVSPAESTLEGPYLQRNLAATRHAYSLDSIDPQTFRADGDLNAGAINADAETLSNLPLWDPEAVSKTYDSLQALKAYYHFSGLSLDRYLLGTGSTRSITPVVVGVRQLDSSRRLRASWVNEHILYTHGYGLIISQATAGNGPGTQPEMAVSGIPVSSAPGAPPVTQPNVYFGDRAASYVVVDTRAREQDVGRGASVAGGHYDGGGGVLLKGFWQRAAFAVKFHDVSLLTSGLITKHSRIIYQQNIRQLVRHAAPFLRVDSHPYPVVANGQIYWMVDCYTTSRNYPYSQYADTGALPGASGLQGSYNYVRDSVKAVVNAYTGRVRFFAAASHDPVLTAWEHVYPGMFQPMRSLAGLSPALVNHLRYPQDLLTLVATMYGRYHFLATRHGAAMFYAAHNYSGVAKNGEGSPYRPVYELLRLPGQRSLHFEAVEPLVPQSATGTNGYLAGFLTADSSYRSYGKIVSYQLPKATASAPAPAMAVADVYTAAPVRRELNLLAGRHSQAILGRTLLVPIDDALLYVQPIYVSTSKRTAPTLQYVAVEYGNDRVALSSTVEGALQQLFGQSVVGVGNVPASELSKEIEKDLDSAYVAYQKSQYDGKHFRLGDLEKQLQKMGQYLRAAHRLAVEEQRTQSPGSSPPQGGSSSSSLSGTVPTTTTPTSSATTSPGSSQNPMVPAA